MKPINPAHVVRSCWVGNCVYKTEPNFEATVEASLKAHMDAKHPGEWDE
jgi:hypothetical protein